MKNLFWAIVMPVILAGAPVSYGAGSGMPSGQPQAGAVVQIDERNRVLVNGEPFFPLGLFVVQCVNGQYLEELDKIADSPFDTIMNYAVNGCGTKATEEQISKYLDEIEKRGLRLIFSLKDYTGQKEMNLDAILRKVDGFKSHPSLLAWYLNDELDPTHLPTLEVQYKLIKEMDPTHPVWSVHWNTEWLLKEKHTTDIVGVDPYPIGNHPITLVSSMADQAIKAGKPLWLVPQIFDWRDYSNDPRAKTGRMPTAEEIRAMTYLAINHGAKGLVYYSYFNIQDDLNFTVRWEEIKKIVNEIRSLRDVILSKDSVGNMILCNSSDIDYKLFRKDKKNFLFAVNIKQEALQSVTFEIKTGYVPKHVSVLFENRERIVLKSDELSDHFDPLAVHVYSWNQE